MHLLVIALITVLTSQQPIPTVAFKLDRFTPLIGEPLELTIQAELPPKISLEAWPEISGDWGVFTIEYTHPLTTHKRDDGVQFYEQKFNIIAWRTGDIETPKTSVTYRVDGIEGVFHIPITPAYLTVPSILETQNLNQLELRPPAQPIRFFFIPWWVVALGMTFGSSIAWFGKRQMTRWSAELKAKRIQSLQKSPSEISLENLETIFEKDIPSTIAQVAAVLRDYITQEFPDITPDQSTDDLIKTLRVNTSVDDHHITELKSILSQADLVKFTPFSPHKEMAERITIRARQWITNTYNQAIKHPND